MINKKRLNDTFMQLCAIDSEPKGERTMASHLKERLAQLGFAADEDETGGKIGGSAGNILARLDGTAPGAPLLFSCHMDRVVPGCGVKPRIEHDFIVGDGTTVLGADDAAGLAAVLEGVAAVRERGVPHPPIEVVFSVAEELALLGSSNFDTGRLASRCGFVLDAAGRVGNIVVRAPEQVKIHAFFHGKNAHAGVAPEQGVSAVQMAAAAICRMRLLRIDSETTANIGSISALSPTNIVPDLCEVWGEARSLEPAKLREQVHAMTEAMEGAAAEFGGRVAIDIIPCYSAYRLMETAEPVRRAARAAERIGITVNYTSTGGGSDANVFNAKGIPTVVLGCGYEKPHTVEERIPLDQLALLAELVVAILTDDAASQTSPAVPE